ncbi:MAG: DUF86 domain-containing protein [Bacteroidales bacterium]|nr:DUF86 domain-containing protein [Bacteroidales bacterium]
MREPAKDKGRLQHILLAIERVREFTSGIKKDELVSDILHLHATVYNVQIIGEAVYKLSKEFKDSHVDTPWSMIEKMRHILVHDYYQVNFDILWIVITEDIPKLEAQIIEYIKELE